MDSQLLPLDIMGEIFKFIPLKTLALCNKKYWVKNYLIFLQSNQLNQTYLRKILRSDSYFIFTQYLGYYFKLFIRPKKIHYNSNVFSSYINFIRHITFDYDSQNCYKILIDLEKKNCVNKKKYKKKITRLNKWSN